MATEGVMKYRIPCGSRSAPNDRVLEELGLAPDAQMTSTAQRVAIR
jgi:hypothetical protein